jgi:hypothetical protein
LLACFNGFVGNIPRTTMNYQGRLHEARMANLRGDCPAARRK